MRHRRRPYRDYEDDDPDSIGETLAAVNDRLDELSLQIERMARRGHVEERAGPRRMAEDRELSAGIGKALAQFNRRLDQLAADIARSGSQRAQSDWLPEPDAAPEADEERKHAAEPPPAAAVPLAPVEGAQDLSGLEDQLRKITEQISSLNRPCRIDDAVFALRSDLADIGRAFSDAMPRQAIEVLEKEMRALSESVERSRELGIDGNKLGLLEHGIAEVRDALRNLDPTENVLAIGHAVQELARKVDQIGGAAHSPAALQKLDQDIAGLREVLRGLEPAENLVEINKAVKDLARKVDQITTANHNPAALQKLDQVIAGLRGIVGHVASNETLAKLAADVRSLTVKFEQIAPDGEVAAARSAPAPDADALARSIGEKLEPRIMAHIDASRSQDAEMLMKVVAEEFDQRFAALGPAPAAPAELAGELRALGERLDRIQLPQGDRAAMAGIEDRIVDLAAKLNESGAWLERLDAIERGMADVLVYLDDLRRAKPVEAPPLDEPRHEPQAQFAQAQPAQAQFAQVPFAQAQFAQVQFAQANGNLRPGPAQELRPELAESYRAEPRRDALPGITELPAVETADEAPAQPAAAPSPDTLTATFEAAEHSLRTPAPAPPEAAAVEALVAALDTKAPPSRGAPRRPINPDLPPDTPIEPAQDTPQLRSSAAERITASEAALSVGKPVAREVATQFETLIAARRAAFAASAEAATTGVAGSRSAGKAAAPGGSRLRAYLRWILLVASIIVIVLGAVKVGMDMWGASDTPETPATSAPTTSDESKAGPSLAPAPGANQTPSRETPAMPPPGDTPPSAPPADSPTSPPVNGSSGPDTLDGASTRPMPEVTGALPQQQPNAARGPGELPAGIAGPTLRAAAAAGNPAAEYEIAVRYAEGRGVTPNVEESARWLERAAKSGFVPAQFRLGSLYDKGGGLKRDRALARQFYTAAAEKGHAKAMHNLAVLYAEGIEGKPNYRMAAHWFRKAAEHGIADSQYNLAILYIRGIGLEQNLAEAYKWFALAANQGDQEAARKRDEVAERLDDQTLNIARQLVRNFVVLPQPDQALSLRTPPGGWDRADASTQPVRPKPRPAAPETPQQPGLLLSPRPL